MYIYGILRMRVEADLDKCGPLPPSLLVLRGMWAIRYWTGTGTFIYVRLYSVCTYVCMYIYWCGSDKELILKFIDIRKGEGKRECF
jgi:hypothetical protein